MAIGTIVLPMKKVLPWLLGILAMAGVSCTRPPGASAASSEAGRHLKVVTTVAPVTNIVHNVGGSRIDLRGIIPEGTDSHTFEPVPSDAAVLGQADLILVNGLDLETPTEKLAEQNMPKGATLY